MASARASAPVFERDGSLKAALTIVAPAERFNGAGKASQIEALKAVAAKLGKSLSGQPDYRLTPVARGGIVGSRT